VTQAYRYGPDPDQWAELLLTGSDRPQPVAVLLHGGFWRTPYTCALMHAMAAALADRGFASWNVEYRRGAGQGTVTLQDIETAIVTLRTLDAPIDLDRMIVVGHSAGGHLALSAGPASGASLVVSLAGVCDLIAAANDHLGNDAAIEFVGATPAAAFELYSQLDPVSMLPSRTRVLLVHGDADDRVPISQSRRYLNAARTAGDECELLELPGVDHMAVIDPRTAAFGAWADRLSDYF
jgi:dipeptidyl aminopeptidase/acylaminoacyl peptidase